MHVDVVGKLPAAGVEVVAHRVVTVLANNIAATFIGIEVNFANGFPVFDTGGGVVEMDVGAVGDAVAVQVALHALEVAAAVVGYEVIGESVESPMFTQLSAFVGEIEAGDEGEVGRVFEVVRRLVEQVDVVAAGAAALVQVLVDDRPALILVGGFEAVHLAFCATDEHQVGDEFHGPGTSESGNREQKRHGYPCQIIGNISLGFHIREVFK